MSLWGKLNGAPLTGTVSLADDTTTVTGTSTLFTSELSVRNVVALDSTEDMYRVLSIVSDTEMTVEPVATAEYVDVAGSFNQVPKYLPLDKAITVDLISVATAQTVESRLIGVKTPGWTTTQTYTDQNGNTRRRVETLIALKP
jgi:hypothetical protein